MYIKSLLLHSHAGQRAALAEEVGNLPQCSVTVADNAELLIVVVDCDSEAESEAVLGRLNASKHLLNLSLVAAYGPRNCSEDTL